jgi:hypothetical protein
MKHKFLLSAILVLLVFGLYTPVSRSQDNGSNPTVTITLANYMQLANDPKHFQFDVYLLRTGPNPLVLFNCQFGFQINQAIKGAGVITAAWKPGSSELVAANLPFVAPAISGTTPLHINCGLSTQANEWVSTIISNQGLGTRVGTLIVSNTVNFPATQTPNIAWSASGVMSKVFCFVGGNGVNTNGVGVDMKANGLQTQAPITIANGMLPVELSSFTSASQGRTVVLNWSTKTEKNSNRFDVERSLVTNGTWSTVASVQASVLSNSTKNYSYSDTKLQSGKYQYRLKMVDNDGTFSYSSVEAAEVSIPKDFAVSQNYPNPFNPTTKIDYQVPTDAKVIMEVYNIAGQKVTELVNQDMSAGYYTIDFGASKLSSGVYIYRVIAVDKATGNNFSSIKKMMLLK